LTEKVPPSRGSSRDKRPLPEADLDAALWPTPSSQATETVPIDTIPGPQPTGETSRPDEPLPASPPAQATSKTPRMPARERLRKERARRARRRRRIRVAAVGAGVVALIAAATAYILVQGNGDSTGKARSAYAGHFAPVTLNSDNSVTMAQPGVSKPVLDVYEDFQCAECRAFERSNGGVIQQLADQGKVRVIYHPFTIFGSQLQQANSIRAWAAAKCAPASLWVRYHNALYASQPADTTANGFQISLLVDLGRKVGIASPDFVQCVRSQKYAAQNPPLSNQIINSGVNGAPVLVLNGKVLNINPVSSRLRQQILSASL
jgi:protein-disulfide isomerase